MRQTLSAAADPATFVSTSAQRTLAEHTADITVSGAAGPGGTAVVLQGRGQEDFAANQYAITIGAGPAGTRLVEHEIATSQGLFVQLATGGRRWFRVLPTGAPASSAAPAMTACGAACTVLPSPGWLLHVLEQPGARVTAMGTPNRAGPNCTEYLVTPAARAVHTAARAETARLGLSASRAASAQRLLASMTPPTLAVWLNPQRQLTCQLADSMQVGMESPKGPRSAPSIVDTQMLVTFTRYGVPVHIAAPAHSGRLTF